MGSFRTYKVEMMKTKQKKLKMGCPYLFSMIMAIPSAFSMAIRPVGKSMREQSTFSNRELKFKTTSIQGRWRWCYLAAINTRSPQYLPQLTIKVEADNEKIVPQLINISRVSKVK